MISQFSKYLFITLFFSISVFADQTSQIGMSMKSGDGLPSKANLGLTNDTNLDSASFYRNLNSSTQGNFFEPKVLRGASSINVYKKGSLGTVLVVSKDGIGSGAILTNKAHIITNQHVVGKNKEVLVFFKKNTNEKPKFEEGILANVLKVDEVSDLALLYVPTEQTPSNMRPIPISDQIVDVGADAHAIGHPSNQLWTYTKGYISQVRNNFVWNEIHSANVLQIQTPINPGNSGGPLLNSNGELIGINSFKDIQNDSMNYAVGNSTIREFLSRKGSRFAELKKECEWKQIGDSYTTEDTDSLGPSFNSDIDFNCDGTTDMTLRVPLDKSKPVVSYIDSNKDGKIDVILYDQNRDKKINFSILDTDFDGEADHKGIHTSGSMIPDRVEPLTS